MFMDSFSSSVCFQGVFAVQLKTNSLHSTDCGSNTEKSMLCSRH